MRSGRYGPYVTEVLPEGAEEKPRTASLLSSMSPENVSLDDALRLLTLPRVVGTLDGEDVTAQNGRYGPYVKKGSESRSLETEEQLFTVTARRGQGPLRRAAAQTRTRRRARAACVSSAPIRAPGRQIVLKDGRFGPYVTDGETNASLRRGDTVEAVTERSNARARVARAERRR